MAAVASARKMGLEKIQQMAKERPYALQTIQTQILFDIASMLEDMGKTSVDLFQEVERMLPKGVFKPYTYSITDRATVLTSSNVPSMPWKKCYIYNDGPSSIYPKINEDEVQMHTPLNLGEMLPIDMGKGNIEKIILVCATALTASVRIFAIK